MSDIAKARRETFRRQFAAFMDRKEVDDWSPEDEAMLREIAITYIEFQAGIDGEPVLDEILKVAKTLGAAKWSKLGDYLKSLE